MIDKPSFVATTHAHPSPCVTQKRKIIQAAFLSVFLWSCSPSQRSSAPDWAQMQQYQLQCAREMQRLEYIARVDELVHEHEQLAEWVQKTFVSDLLRVVYEVRAELVREGSSRRDGRLPVLAQKIPNSLIVAQAIIESGWGRSSAALYKNNLFGIMSPKKPSQAQSFVSVKEGVCRYLRLLLTSENYSDFQLALLHNQTRVSDLIDALGEYNEEPEVYRDKIKWVIWALELRKFDVV